MSSRDGQIEWRLAPLPTIGQVPRLGGGVAKHATLNDETLDLAFGPVIRWIVEGRARVPNATEPDPPLPEQHVANRLYRETFDR